MLASLDPGSEGAVSRAGSDARVLDLLPAARERIATVFANDPAAQARVHRVLGRAYTNLQQFPEAETEIKAALALLPALEDNPVEKAKVLYAAGALDYLLSHQIEEERELRQALQIFESTPALAADVAEHAIYVATLAQALADVGKQQEAERYADRAAGLAAGIPSPSPVRTGIIHYNLAMSYLKIGRLERARSEARLAAAQLSLSARPLSQLPNIWMWLAIVERSLGNLADARKAAERSVEAATRFADADPSLTIAPRIELAYLQALTGDFSQAIPELTRCLAQARAASSQEDLLHALHSLGYALTLAGQASQGEPLLREAMRVGAGFLSMSSPSMGVCSFELGECLERLGRPTEARALYRTAYDNLRSYYGPVYATLQAQMRLEALAGDDAANRR
jgi:tetratricopeptide (TPR) repeat protein